MMGTIKLSWITLICIATLLASPQDYPRLAPYSAVRWKESTPEVKVDGSWYELIALNGLPCEKIVSFCKETYGAKWQQRFGEDLVQTLTEMGHEPEETVDLKVRHLEKDEVSLLNDVAMTKENRLAVINARRAKRKKGPAPAEPAAVLIPGEGARADLDELRHRIASQYSYASWRGAGYKTALEELKSGLGDSIPLNELQIRIQKFLAMFGDGHSRIAGFPGRVLPRGYAPFLFGEAEGRLFVFQEDRSDFVDPEHPYLRSMDGLDVESWLRAAREIVAQGSPQWVRRQSVRNLRYVIYLRQALGLKQSRAIRMVLESEDGKRTRPREVRIATISRPAYGPWPHMNNQVLPGEIGYLRIERMESDSKVLDALRRSMRRFERTRGLIIDVRGNGGGTRDVLRTLLPYFLKEDDGPRVVNVAAYRLPPGISRGEKEGYLENRFLFPVTSKVWSEAEKGTIAKFSGGFRPEWAPPEKDFSAWHYMVISPMNEGDQGDNGDLSLYDKPVVVLLDEGCFSATDVFLGAFKGLSGVTLMGTPSGGGSGRVARIRLLHSQIVLTLSSMASFQPNGMMYDGNGVEPDVVVRPLPSDSLGRTDTLLEAALKHLQ